LNVQHLNLESFKDKVWDFENSSEKWNYKGDKPCIIDFYANWCGPCKQIAPIMEELAVKYKGKINIYKVNTDKEQKLSRTFGIKSIPAVLFSPMDGQPMKKTGALSKEAYIKLIEELLLK
jgi:thioredoxin